MPSKEQPPDDVAQVTDILFKGAILLVLVVYVSIKLGLL